MYQYQVFCAAKLYRIKHSSEKNSFAVGNPNQVNSFVYWALLS